MALGLGFFSEQAFSDAGGNDLAIDLDVGTANFAYLHSIILQCKAATTADKEVVIGYKTAQGSKVYTVRIGGGVASPSENLAIPMGNVILPPNTSAITVSMTKPVAGGVNCVVMGWVSDVAPASQVEPLMAAQGFGTNRAIPVEGTASAVAQPTTVSSGAVSITGTATVSLGASGTNTTPLVVQGKVGATAMPVSGTVNADLGTLGTSTEPLVTIPA